MLTNTGEDTVITIQGEDASFKSFFLIDKEHHMTQLQENTRIFTLKKNQVVLLSD